MTDGPAFSLVTLHKHPSMSESSPFSCTIFTLTSQYGQGLPSQKVSQESRSTDQTQLQNTRNLCRYGPSVRETASSCQLVYDTHRSLHTVTPPTMLVNLKPHAILISIAKVTDLQLPASTKHISSSDNENRHIKLMTSLANKVIV